jgi:hypothetical protein
MDNIIDWSGTRAAIASWVARNPDVAVVHGPFGPGYLVLLQVGSLVGWVGVEPEAEGWSSDYRDAELAARLDLRQRLMFGDGWGDEDGR